LLDCEQNVKNSLREPDVAPPADSDLAKALPALRRAARRAREIAYETGTPLVLAENGHVVERWITTDPRQGNQ
jgi:hypothetical protein